MANKEYDNTNRGVLFRKKEKDSPKHPDWSGSINIKFTPEVAKQALSNDGVDLWLSAWVRESQNQNVGKFFSLSLGDVKNARPSVDLDDDDLGGNGDNDFGSDSAPKSKPDLDDEIPF